MRVFVPLTSHLALIKLMSTCVCVCVCLCLYVLMCVAMNACVCWCVAKGIADSRMQRVGIHALTIMLWLVTVWESGSKTNSVSMETLLRVD